MSLPLRTEVTPHRPEIDGLRGEATRSSVLNVLAETTPRERPRSLTEFRPVSRPMPSAEQPVREEASVAPATALLRDSHSAFELLEQASHVIPVLMGRCRQLESDVAAAEERTRSEMEAAELVAQRYQALVQDLQTKVNGLQADLLAMTERAQNAESNSEKIQVNAERTRQQAAEAECLTALFHDKVMAALGNNSPAFAVLQSMRPAAAGAAAPVTSGVAPRVRLA